MGNFDNTVTALLDEFECQPVLFVGAGLSRRYMGTPGWEGVLRQALEKSQIQGPEFEYYFQKNNGNLIGVGTDIADEFFEWAWKDKTRFPEPSYRSKDKSIFLKNFIAEILPKFEESNFSNSLKEELEKFKNIRPHAIITTNYDDMLESIFEGYEAIVGKGVLRYNLNSFGEIFHIHGSALSPESMILVHKDYEGWHRESQYFASKLLTYFVEHPIFILGYSLGDPNIRTVLGDIGRIVADDTGLIRNVLQIIWNPDIEEAIQREYSIEEGENQYRIRVIEIADLSGVYSLLLSRHELKDVNPALVRALAARVMKLTRKDIPNGEIEINYQVLESLTKDDSDLPRMLGLTLNDDPNKTHPFTLGIAAERMGLKSFNNLLPVIKKIQEKTGVDLRCDDNRYHLGVRTGKSPESVSHKWSHAAIDLFQKVINGEEYSL